MKRFLSHRLNALLITALLLAALGAILPVSSALANPAADGEPPHVVVQLTSTSGPLAPIPMAPTWDFGNQWINTTSYELTFTITFVGPDPFVALGTVAMSGDFNILNDNCSGKTLFIGESCSIGITFEPLSIGYQIGTLSIPYDLFFTSTWDFAGTGINPIVGLSASSHNFGNQLVGTTSGAFTFTVTNTGTTDLYLGTLGISGEFGLSNNTCDGATLIPTGTCTFDVTFSPLSIGAKAGSVSIPSNAVTSPDIVSLSGNGVQPDLVITKTNDVSGSVVYPNSWHWKIRVTNNGTADAVFTGQTVWIDNLPTGGIDISWNAFNTGGGTTWSVLSFALSGSDGYGGGTMTLPPGGWFETDLIITPTAPGTYANPRAGGICAADPDTLLAESNEGNNNCSDTVTVTAPAVGLSTTSLAFGDQLMGTTSAAQTVTLTNTGNANLHIGLLSFTSDWILSNDTCSNATILPGNICTFDVAFHPLALGPLTGSITIPSDAASSPNSVSLSGNGVQPAVGLSATSLEFGNVLVGTTSPAQTITLTNTGTAALTFTVPAFQIASPFDATTDCGTTLDPGASCHFYVTFSPTALGYIATNLMIYTDAPSTPDLIPLYGTGVAIPDGVNLLKKPDFATAAIFPTPWKLFGVRLPYSSALDCAVFQLAPCSVFFPAGNRSAMQQVNRTGFAGDMYLFGLSSISQNAPIGGNYRVEVSFYNNFNRPMGSTSLSFSPLTHGWETVSGYAIAAGNYNKILFRFYYQNSSGRAWFDDAFLMVVP